MTVGDRSGDPLGRWLHDLVRAARWHRRLVAAGLLAGSVALTIHALEPPAPATVAVVAAARDLPAGARLTDAHLTVVQRPERDLPGGALRDLGAARGATAISAVRRGEVITDVRVMGRAAMTGLGIGLVATPVRIADAESVGLLRPGDVVDVLAAGAPEGPAPGEARLMASGVRILTVPQAASGRLVGSFGEGALVVVATTTETAARLAAASVTDRLSIVLRGE